jgi:hypothetical protein
MLYQMANISRRRRVHVDSLDNFQASNVSIWICLRSSLSRTCCSMRHGTRMQHRHMWRTKAQAPQFLIWKSLLQARPHPRKPTQNNFEKSNPADLELRNV